MDASAIGTVGLILHIVIVGWAVLTLAACVVAVVGLVRAYLHDDDDPRRRARVHAKIESDNAAWRASLHEKAIAQNRYKRPDTQPLTSL